MKIIGTKKEQIEIDVSNRDIIDSFSKILYSRYKWKDNYIIFGDSIYEEVETFGGHRNWTEKVFVRKATQDDIKNVEFIKEFNKRAGMLI